MLPISQLLLALLANSAVAQQAQEAATVQWQAHWPKFHPIEYVTTVALGVSTLLLQLDGATHTSGPYGGLLFDDGVRDALRARTPAVQNTLEAIGDWGYRVMLVAPHIDLAISLAIHRNTEVAWQMLWINLEAQAVAGFFALVSNHLVTRARPNNQPCNSDLKDEESCDRGEFNSFLSGHTVTAAAGAGAICAHHLSMPLYGGGAGDIIACAVSSTAALMVGVSRIVNDRHWATDIIPAWLIGAAAGYVWPRLFHYRSKSVGTPNYALLPGVTPESVSARLIVWN